MLQKLSNRLKNFRRRLGYRKAFLSKRQFERAITRERIRASRRRIPFCVVTINVLDSRSAVSKVARVLLRKLRQTDEKALLADGDFAVLLVDTSLIGGRTVVDRLTLLFEDHGINFNMELQGHDPSTFDGNGSDDFLDDSNIREIVPPREVSVSGSLARENWGEASSWQSEVIQVTERRSMTSDPRHSVFSQRANEIVSTDDPLVRSSSVSGVLKRGVDIAGALVGLVVAGPLLLAAMILIRLTSPGSPIFCQTREGYRGKPFTIYKLRSMVAGAENSQHALRELSHRDGPAFKIKSDPRVTRIGRFLRATCIDELPQLVNVLIGDMSVVGPRPLPWHESRACSHWHRRRLDVRPGLTCFWQINKSSVETFDDWMRLDLEYVDRRSLWVDSILIYRTMSVAILGRGGH